MIHFPALLMKTPEATEDKEKKRGKKEKKWQSPERKNTIDLK